MSAQPSRARGARAAPEVTESPYRMTIDLNVLDHLGVNLYSNFAAVLTEVVANAWDADAENVSIRVDRDARSVTVTIRDDGVGMTGDDINERFLRVGYRRRDDGAVPKRTAKSRVVMGRKGLGKLSLFSIADEVEVQSAKDGERHGFRMSIEGIRRSVRGGRPDYNPEPLPRKDISVDRGTMLVLRKVRRQRIGKSEAALRKRLARRFSVIGESSDFRVGINGEPVTPADRVDLSSVQFLWEFGNGSRTLGPRIVERGRLPSRAEKNGWRDGWVVRGWLGTARYPRDLYTEDTGNLNSVVVFARGRLVHENILDKINDGRLYTKYLTGQIEADFLDQDDKPDIATSDRQRIQEDDERYVRLVGFLRSSLCKVEKEWSALRQRHEVRAIRGEYPSIRAWLDDLPQGLGKDAKGLIARLSALPLSNPDDRRLLFRHGILAFERIRLRGSTRDLSESILDTGKLLQVLADRDAFEGALYCDIVRSRLEVIQQFQNIVASNELEKVLQRYLFDHLWLLEPAWGHAKGSEEMEKVLRGDSRGRAGQKTDRIDIAYRTHEGKHIIVELKRADRAIGLLDLVGQGSRYVDALKKALRKTGEETPDIHVVFVLGKPISEDEPDPDRVKHMLAGVSSGGGKIVYYDSLIKGAKEAYSNYLERHKRLDKINAILADLGQDDD